MAEAVVVDRPVARPSRRAPRVVLAHDFAETFGGAERLFAEVAAEFPEAGFHTILGRREVGDRMGLDGRFHSILPASGPLLRHYRLLAPLYPRYVRHRRLPAADVLVTSSYAFIHGIATENDAPQLCYCHSPLRLAWSQSDAYNAELPAGRALAPAFRAFAAYMRRADRAAARRVTRYVTQSPFTQGQLRDCFGVEAHVVPPPVDIERFRPTGEPVGDHYLFAGRLVEAYKKPSLVVRAFAELPHLRLVVAGDGPARCALEEIATPNVTFVGQLEDEDLVSAMATCRATIFPSIDDFGLIPVEVAACGRPVIAFAGGGALHTVVDGVTGAFFHEQSVAAVREAVAAFDADAFDPAAMRAHALRWDRRNFRAEMRRHVEELAA